YRRSTCISPGYHSTLGGNDIHQILIWRLIRMDIPIYATVSVLAASAFAVVAVPIALARASGAARLRPWTAAAIGLALGVWLVATAVLAARGAYQPAAGEAAPAVGVALV